MVEESSKLKSVTTTIDCWSFHLEDNNHGLLVTLFSLDHSFPEGEVVPESTCPLLSIDLLYVERTTWIGRLAELHRGLGA